MTDEAQLYRDRLAGFATIAASIIAKVSIRSTPR
jgi:hypothetical protein